MRFATTGQLPRTVEPRSPLIDLLLAISPRDRCAIVGLKVDDALGYSGSRMFHSAEAALRWVRPSEEMLESQSWPAKSYRIKRLVAPLSLQALLAKASSFPPDLADRYTALMQTRFRPARMARGLATCQTHPNINYPPTNMPLSPSTPLLKPATHTPAIAEYLAIKADYPSTLLFYRMGDYYELFFEDAAKGARLLEITLTRKTALNGDPIPMAGVPYHALERHLAELTALGESVAICEPISKGASEREVRVVAPDPLQDSDLPGDSTEVVLSPAN